MSEGADEERAETKRRQHAEKENDVSRRPEEDCSSPKGEMGEGEGGAEEVGVAQAAQVITEDGAGSRLETLEELLLA